MFVLFIAFSLSTMSMTTHHLPAAALSFVVFAGLAGLLYINQKRKANAALIPIAMLHNPTLSLSLLMSMLSYSTQLLAFVSLPFYFHNVLQRNVVDIGLLLTAWPLATMASSLISGDLAKKYDPNLVALSGLACLLAGMLLMANLPSDPSNGAIVWRVALCGIGFGLFQSPNNLLIMTSVSHENSSIASGLLGSSRLIGQIVGSALVAIFFNMRGAQATNISLMAGAAFSFLSLVVSYMRFKSAVTLKTSK